MGSVGRDKPIVVQSDKTILLEADSPLYPECRDWLSRFAELVKSPEHIHTYRLTPLAVWNAAASGMTSHQLITFLSEYGRYEVPQNVRRDIADWFGRYGKLKLERYRENTIETDLTLKSEDPILITEIYRSKHVRPLIAERVDEKTLVVENK
mgnify:CR=1 FL=1